MIRSWSNESFGARAGGTSFTAAASVAAFRAPP
jgi:hypothetical protein